jgi:pimeloyl-ACP methyl ester carboxylesterase
MTSRSRPRSLLALPVAVLLLLVLLGARPALAADRPLDWRACGEAPDVECATLTAPLDYDRPDGRQIDLHVARVPATDPDRRLGSLVFNFGGPGAAAAFYVELFGRELFPELASRYDIVGIDPRGTGASEGAIDCQVNQETDGIYSAPFPTPLTFDQDAYLGKVRRYIDRCLELNRRSLLAHASTANVARDLDELREALDERRLTYFGFSYGTFLGATYATLFPNRYERMVLDGPVDADGYVNDPSGLLFEQTSGFERGLGRFLMACAADQQACSGFGGADPWKAYDALIDRANAEPIPAPGYAPDPRPVDGDDIINATLADLYARQLWGELAFALALAEAGDGTGIRFLTDIAWARNEDGTYDPALDRYFVLGAVEQEFSRDVADAIRGGNRSWGAFDHFYLNSGYVDANYALWPVKDADRYRGPFRIADDASTPLVVATTYDPATPFNGARRLVRDLGRARFLKVRGDGHTAYDLTGPCARDAVNRYLLEGVLPAAGTVCEAEQPFEAFVPRAAATARTAAARLPRHVDARLKRPIPNR